MMLDMMPSDPLPAMTFATLRSILLREPFAQIQAAVRIIIDSGGVGADRLQSQGRRPQRILIRSQLGDLV